MNPYGEALSTYSGLMEEAKQRLLDMDTALAGQTGLTDGSVCEFCFLQLRMLCEVIALGCLTAHGDLQVGKLKQDWKADRIVRRLEELHSDFYPIAATQTMAGPDLYDAVLRKDGFLTKEELLKLYWKCGDVLHRGSLQTLPLLRSLSADIKEIKDWKQKIEVLLDYHAIFMCDNKTLVLFVLRNRENNNQVQWLILEEQGILSLLGPQEAAKRFADKFKQ
jgi:hypothetical protein